MTKKLKALLIALLMLCPILCAQDPPRHIYPKYLITEPGITAFSYDNAKHPPVQHYMKLFTILCNQLDIKIDADSKLVLIFISDSTKVLLKQHDPDAFTEDWVGYFISPGVIVMNDNGDDTFFHEAMHYLSFREGYLKELPPDVAHMVISQNEKLLMFCPEYLNYIKTLK